MVVTRRGAWPVVLVRRAWWLITFKHCWLLASLGVFYSELWIILSSSRRCCICNYLLVIHALSESCACANLHWLFAFRVQHLRSSGLICLRMLKMQAMGGVMDLWSTPRPEHLAWRLNLFLVKLLLTFEIVGSYVGEKSSSILCLLHSVALLLKANAHLVPGWNHWVILQSNTIRRVCLFVFVLL